MPTRRYLALLARFGYFARGLVFLTIGIFAALAAFGRHRSLDPQLAIDTLLASRAGGLMALLLVSGLTCFGVYRFVQGLIDTEDFGSSWFGLASRIAYGGVGFFYLGLAIYALAFWLRIVQGPTGGADSLARTISTFIGQTPAASVLALFFAALAVSQYLIAWKGTYVALLRADAPILLIHWLGRIGLPAFGTVFAVMASLFAYRAATAEPSYQGVGFADALEFLWRLPMGEILLAAMGIGLIAFALFAFALGWWAEIRSGRIVDVF